jgi:hypothetical protein
MQIKSLVQRHAFSVSLSCLIRHRLWHRGQSDSASHGFNVALLALSAVFRIRLIRIQFGSGSGIRIRNPDPDV